MENNKKRVRIEATTTGLQAFADELQSHVEAAENREAHKLQYSGPAQPTVQYMPPKSPPPVSYTHLTLPTNKEVYITEGAV